MARAGDPLADHAEDADLFADRRDRRGGDDIAARTARRRAQLGLTHLLHPRRDPDTLFAARRWLSPRAPPLHLLEGNGLGRLRPRRQIDRAVRRSWGAGALGETARQDRRRNPRQRFRPRAQYLRSVLWLEGTRRRAAATAQSGVSAG